MSEPTKWFCKHCEQNRTSRDLIEQHISSQHEVFPLVENVDYENDVMRAHHEKRAEQRAAAKAQRDREVFAYESEQARAEMERVVGVDDFLALCEGRL